MNPWLCNLLFNNSGGSSLPVTGQTFYASLKTSLVPEVGTGGPTWSRATAAWRFNDLGLLRQIPSGCAEFGGARLVVNLCPTPSNTLVVAGTKTVTLTAAATLQFSMGAGTGTATFSGTGGATGTLNAGASRVSVNKTVTAGTFVVTASVADLVDLSIVDVTGRDASYVPEYVSVGADNANELINTEDATQSSWSVLGGVGTKTATLITDGPNGVAVNGCRLTVGASTSTLRIQGSGNVTSGRNLSASVYVRKISGSGSVIIIDINDGSNTSISVSSAWVKAIAENKSHSSSSTKALDVSCSTASGWVNGDIIEVCYPQYNYGNTVNAYACNGPAYSYHGAGADGCKYFATDWQGAPIPIANLTRLRKELSATNNLLWSRDLRQVNWTVAATGPEFVVNGGFAADTDWTKETGWSIAAGVATKVAGIGGSLKQTILTTVGKTYFVEIICTVSAGSLSVAIGSSGIQSPNISSGGTYTYKVIAGIGTQVLNVYGSATYAGTVDSVSVRESTVQCTQSTGLDGIANSATTLTATAPDAIILQPITLASAARCASAYVRRKTGTGTISFTQDGGSTWTDITAQLNTSTYSRVQITSTLANPSVGFKIATSGDAIEVDCVQNEAGSVATSPIVTTTASVTRNTDSLTYLTSGNIDFTVGAIFALCRLYAMTTGSSQQIVRVSTNGYMYVNNGDVPGTIRAYDGTTAVAKTGLDNITSKMSKRAVSWGGTTQTVAGNGLTSAPASFDGGFGDGTTITVGNVMQGHIGDVAIYNYKMTDAELQEITT